MDIGEIVRVGERQPTDIPLATPALEPANPVTPAADPVAEPAPAFVEGDSDERERRPADPAVPALDPAIVEFELT